MLQCEFASEVALGKIQAFFFKHHISSRSTSELFFSVDIATAVANEHSCEHTECFLHKLLITPEDVLATHKDFFFFFFLTSTMTRSKCSAV